jgi:hypothetical protein
MADPRDEIDATENATTPGWARLWHLRFVMVPRRSITGKLVRGLVWRRREGRRWIYKRFTEFDDRGNSN